MHLKRCGIVCTLIPHEYANDSVGLMETDIAVPVTPIILSCSFIAFPYLLSSTVFSSWHKRLYLNGLRIVRGKENISATTFIFCHHQFVSIMQHKQEAANRLFYLSECLLFSWYEHKHAYSYACYQSRPSRCLGASIL